jgi:hypothetical protein
VRSKAYSIGALFLVLISIACSILGYRRGEQYRVWLSKQPAEEQRLRQLHEQGTP